LRERWKRTEREVAKHIGGRRVPITGRGRGDVPDIAHTWLSPEVKCRGVVPAWLEEALVQAKAAAKQDQLPVAIIHKVGQEHADDLVVLRLKDFKDWFVG
jgi:hypothetical protein